MGMLQGSWAVNPFDLEGVRELARLSGIKLRARSNELQIQQLFKLWGKETTFADNIANLPNALTADSKIPSEEIRTLLLAPGTLDAQPLRTVYGPVAPGGQSLPVFTVVTGGVINWMDLRCQQLDLRATFGEVQVNGVVGLASATRLCNTQTETDHPLVVDAAPKEITEADGLHALLRRLGLASGFVMGPGQGNLESQVRQFFAGFTPQNVYVPANANALHIVLLVLRVLRELWGPQFGGMDSRFQLYFSCQERPLATTMAQHDDPMGYQRPLTVPSGTVRLIHEMHLWQATV